VQIPEVEEFFAGVRGQRCWSVIGGAGSGSVISLQFGIKVPLSKWSKNPTLSPEERRFEGERILTIYCDWRLEAVEIICSSQDADGTSIDLRALESIKNCVVSEISFTSRQHDLRVEFDNGMSLAVFCDLPVGEVESPNVVMLNPTSAISIDSRGRLLVENR